MRVPNLETSEMTLRKKAWDESYGPTDGQGRCIAHVKAEQKNRSEAQRLAAGRESTMSRHLDAVRKTDTARLELERRADRAVEEHRRLLADEADRARQRALPNPWLKPWDQGYESPTEVGLRNVAEFERRRPAAFAEPAPLRTGRVDRAAEPAGAVESSPGESLVRMSEEEVFLKYGQKGVSARRGYISGRPSMLRPGKGRRATAPTVEER